MAKILVVDDQPYIGQLLSAELEDEGYSVESVKDAKLLSKHLDDDQPDLVLLDLYLKGFKGWSILHNIKEKNPDLPVLIFTAYDTFAEDPRLSKADGYVIKSLDGLDELKEKIAEVIGRNAVPGRINGTALAESGFSPLSDYQ